jgi:hypothetical protein
MTDPDIDRLNSDYDAAHWEEWEDYERNPDS